MSFSEYPNEILDGIISYLSIVSDGSRPEAYFNHVYHQSLLALSF